MTQPTPVTSPATRRARVGLVVLMFGGALGLSSTLSAQAPPPIGGVTGTVALEGTVQQEYAAANTVIVKTADGVEHLFHYTKDLLVHGGKGGGVEALRGLRPGTTVAVHYTIAGTDATAVEIDHIGDEGLRVTEGTVIRVDRGRKEITVRFDNGHDEVFQLTNHAAMDAGHEIDQTTTGTGKVTVYYTDEAGHKVAHFFDQESEALASFEAAAVTR